MEIKDTYKYNSVDVARYIVAYANEHKYGINMTKLQKLLYIVYGSYLVLHQERLTNEHPHAWPFGPVFPTTRSKLLKCDFSEIRLSAEGLKVLSEDTAFTGIVKTVFDTFGAKTGGYLSAWSHLEGSPLDRLVKSPGFVWGDIIPDGSIAEYFNSIIKRK